jgi:hypothetical protein
MIISALESYGLDFSDEERTQAAAKDIRSMVSADIEIDFSGCILDYFATGQVVEAALMAQRAAQAPRRLVLTFNIPFQERLFIKWFFFGGSLLGPEHNSMELDEMREHISSALRQHGTTVIIKIRTGVDTASTELYKYG